jgi:hypothetical protein
LSRVFILFWGAFFKGRKPGLDATSDYDEREEEENKEKRNKKAGLVIV